MGISRDRPAEGRGEAACGLQAESGEPHDADGVENRRQQEYQRQTGGCSPAGSMPRDGERGDRCNDPEGHAFGIEDEPGRCEQGGGHDHRSGPPAREADHEREKGEEERGRDQCAEVLAVESGQERRIQHE